MIIGIEGGIGTGKTLTLAYMLLNDYNNGKTIYSNVHLKKTKYQKLNGEFMSTILEKVKNKSLIMKNSTVGIQEIHNYMDSRNAMSKKNKIISYWILQSRHTGEGSCTIIYDTQELGQVDLRLRRNTDMVIRPQIIQKVNKVPTLILLEMMIKVKHQYKRFKQVIDVKNVVNKYDTHEVVDI